MNRLRERHLLRETAGAEAVPGGSPEGETPPADPTPAPIPDDWRSGLPLDLANDASLKDVPDVTTLAKQYRDTKAMVGSSVRIPSSEAGQEAVEAFAAKILEHQNIPLMRKPDPDNPEALASLYESLGRPAEASGYEMPEGVDPEAYGAMKETAHELGLTNTQLQQLASKQAAMQQAAIEQMEEARIAGVSEIKGEWGPAFNEKVARGTQVAEATGAPAKLVEAMKAGAVDGETLRWLDTLATQLGSEGSQLAQQLGEVQAETFAELEQKIADRTTRLIKEDRALSPAEKDRLMQANIKDRQRIIDARG